MPGTAPTSQTLETRGPGWFVSNGNYQTQNNFVLDGFDNNQGTTNAQSMSTQVVQPSPDAIGEFKVQTNSFSAEFGRSAGAVINVSLKSGSNRLSGSAPARPEEVEGEQDYADWMQVPREVETAEHASASDEPPTADSWSLSLECADESASPRAEAERNACSRLRGRAARQEGLGNNFMGNFCGRYGGCLLYTSPSPRD